MPTEEPAIRLLELPELWPPLAQGPTATTVPLSGPGDVKPLPLGQGRMPAPAEGPALPRQFAALLAEVLAGVRPERQVTPWLSKRGTIHLHRLLPLFQTGHQPRVLRVLATRPAPDVVEMTVIAVIGPRPHALAIRLEHTAQPPRWQCTDIESA
jgi:Family of unknown function (DUF6459)